MDWILVKLSNLADGNRWVSIVTATCIAGLGAWYLLASRSEESGSYDEAIDLLDFEVIGLIYLPSIGTISYYKGDITANNHLKKRWIEVLKSNPWLTGHLRYVKDEKLGGKKALKAVYNTRINEEEIGKFYHEVVVDKNDKTGLYKIDENFPMEKIKPLLDAEHGVKAGYEVIGNPNEPLARLVVLKFLDDKVPNKINRSALIFFFSHVIGDGYTYYTILCSLNLQKTGPVPRLIPQRIHHFHKQIDEIYGPEFQIFLKTKFLFIALRNFLFGRKTKIHRYVIDKKKIEEIKLAYSSSVNSSKDSSDAPFISTNDIVTSWFFKTIKVRYGLMAINYRNRLPGFTDAHAGNYEGLVMFHEDDFQSPLDIRQAVRTYRSKSNRIPNILESIEGSLAVITNWASFYTPLVFPDCELLLHSPILVEGDLLVHDLMIIHRSKQDELSLTVLTRSRNIPFEQLCRDA